MKLFYDKNDLPHAKKLKDDRLAWLQELDAVELSDARADDEGFLFSYHHGTEAHARQIENFPGICDRPEERDELVRLDAVLGRMNEAGIQVPSPRTWILTIDDDLPADLEFPLFVRTPVSSWKRGGDQAKVSNAKQLVDEMELLRRAFGWDVPILARRWIDVAVAGQWMFGNAPQEIRTWIVDGVPIAWSFHYLHAVSSPVGFPPSADDLNRIAQHAAQVAGPFSSRLIAADFIRDRNGQWHFLEAGPGAVAGTAHKAVFKYVATRLIGEECDLKSDSVGGVL